MSHALVTLLTFTVPAALVLGFVITMHELGHFLMARACGVAVDQFSIGFGQALLRWTDKGGVEWRLGWIPLGGYVRFAGDLNAASVPDREELAEIKAEMFRKGGIEAVQSCYHFKPVWQRALIAFAGPLANFLLAVVLFAVLFSTLGDVTRSAKVLTVTPGGIAAAAGFQPGDVVLKAGRHRIASFDDLVNEVSLRAGVPMDFLVQRGGVRLTLHATPEAYLDTDAVMGRRKIGRIGLTGGGPPILTRYNPVMAVAHGAERSWDVLATTGYYFGRLVSGQASADQIGGVIGIAHATGKVTEETVREAPTRQWVVVGLIAQFLNLSAVLSVSIGFLNLLPIPMLDGGHLAFYGYEAVARRPLPSRIQDASYRVGLALLVGFMLFAAWNDLNRFNLFGGLFS